MFLCSLLLIAQALERNPSQCLCYPQDNDESSCPCGHISPGRLVFDDVAHLLVAHLKIKLGLRSEIAPKKPKP